MVGLPPLCARAALCLVVGEWLLSPTPPEAFGTAANGRRYVRRHQLDVIANARETTLSAHRPRDILQLATVWTARSGHWHSVGGASN